MCHSTMLDYHFSKFELIYSVYYYFSYLFYREIKKMMRKTLDILFINLRIF